MSLKQIPTKELVDESKIREGVESEYVKIPPMQEVVHKNNDLHKRLFQSLLLFEGFLISIMLSIISLIVSIMVLYIQ